MLISYLHLTQLDPWATLFITKILLKRFEILYQMIYFLFSFCFCLRMYLCPLFFFSFSVWSINLFEYLVFSVFVCYCWFGEKKSSKIQVCWNVCWSCFDYVDILYVLFDELSHVYCHVGITWTHSLVCWS